MVGYDPICEREAANDPQVQALRAGAASVARGSSNSSPQQANAAYRQAALACMQRRGLALPGGVEAVQRPPYSPLGF